MLGGIPGPGAGPSRGAAPSIDDFLLKPPDRRRPAPRPAGGGGGRAVILPVGEAPNDHYTIPWALGAGRNAEAMGP